MPVYIAYSIVVKNLGLEFRCILKKEIYIKRVKVIFVDKVFCFKLLKLICTFKIIEI